MAQDSFARLGGQGISLRISGQEHGDKGFGLEIWFSISYSAKKILYFFLSHFVVPDQMYLNRDTFGAIGAIQY